MSPALSTTISGGPAMMASGLLALSFATILAVLVWQLITARIATFRARRSEALAAYAAAVLDEADIAWFTVHEEGSFHCSERLRAWFNLPFLPAGLDDLGRGVDMAALAPDSWRALNRAVEELVREGTGFRLRLKFSDGLVDASGQRIDDDRTGRFALITFDEHRADAIDPRHPNRSPDHWRRLIDAAPIPIWLRDESLNLVKVNATYARAVERENPKAVVEHNVELASSALATAPRTLARRALETGVPAVHSQYAVVEGQRRALRIYDIPLADSEGNKLGVAGFALDMTELEEARAQLTRTIESHAETLDRLVTPVAMFGGDKRLEFCNSAFATLWDLNPTWLAEKPHHGELLEAMRERRKLPEQANFPAWKQQQLGLYTTLLDLHEELWHLPGGSTWRIVTQPHPMGGLLLLFEDVTDRLALERSYNTLIAVQRETLNNLLEAVAVFGSDGRLQLYNSNFARTLGIEEGFLEAAPHFREFADSMGPLAPDGVRPANWRQILSNLILAHRAASGRWPRPDGLVFDYAAVPLPDGAVLITLEDVTASVRVQEALADRNAALEAADKLKSNFVANVSYELRTPLNSIVGYSELLKGEFFGGLNDKQHEYVAAIMTSSDELALLINEILDLAAIEAGGIELETEEIDAAELARMVGAMSSEMVRKESRSMHVHAPDGLGMITADRRRLQQGFYSLVLNALQWTAPGDNILVSVEADGDGFLYSVSDTGPGLTDEQQAALFEAFRPGSRTGTPARGNLGFVLVRRFIELHGGRMTLDSHEGKGTVVNCYLPRTPKPQAPAAALP